MYTKIIAQQKQTCLSKICLPDNISFGIIDSRLFTFLVKQSIIVKTTYNSPTINNEFYAKIKEKSIMPKFCRNCGNQLSDDAVFCSVCGTRLNTIAPPVQPQHSSQIPYNHQPGTNFYAYGQPQKKKGYRWIILIAAVSVVLIAVVIVALFVFPGFLKTPPTPPFTSSSDTPVSQQSDSSRESSKPQESKVYLSRPRRRRNCL